MRPIPGTITDPAMDKYLRPGHLEIKDDTDRKLKDLAKIVRALEARVEELEHQLL